MNKAELISAPNMYGLIEYAPEVRLVSNATDVGVYAAQAIACLVKDKPKAVLGLPTGGTPLPMYRELVRFHEKEGLDFSQATFFNLDEYIGLHATHPQSYHAYMQNNFFGLINVSREQFHIPDGMAADIQKEADNYERLIRLAGGIDLQVLGLGRDGHIAFCSPGTPFDGLTGKTALPLGTRQANARFFAGIDDVPTHAISMGLATILQAKNIILLASGSEKEKAVQALLQASISTTVPATILRRHPHFQMVVDHEAFPQPEFGYGTDIRRSFQPS